MRLPRSPVRTYGEIVEELAATPHPDVARDPDESLAVLERLIREARAALSPSRRRGPAQVFAHQSPASTRAMLLIGNAPAEELRGFVQDLVDLLRGEGEAGSKREARRLNFDKEWEGGTIDEVAFALSEHSFYPFPRE